MQPNIHLTVDFVPTIGDMVSQKFPRRMCDWSEKSGNHLLKKITVVTSEFMTFLPGSLSSAITQHLAKNKIVDKMEKSQLRKCQLPKTPQLELFFRFGSRSLCHAAGAEPTRQRSPGTSRAWQFEWRPNGQLGLWCHGLQTLGCPAAKLAGWSWDMQSW